MTSIASYTAYIPGKPLVEQLEILHTPRLVVANFGMPYNVGVAQFKPLKVNENVLDISLTVRSAVGSSKENGVYVYDRYAFVVKGIGNDAIDLKDVPGEKIDETLRKIFESTLTREAVFVPC